MRMAATDDRQDRPEQTEVLAVLVSGYDESGTQRATVVLRDREGRVRMRQVDAQDEFVLRASQDSCFRRGKPVRDPRTGEVIRYELEKVTLSH